MKKSAPEGSTAAITDGKSAAAPAPRTWYLEAKILGRGGVQRFVIDVLPFRIGRRSTSNLKLSSLSVSSDHAELFWSERTRELLLRDLGSTNGTFVNEQRVDLTPVVEGDILHFADAEFRVGQDTTATTSRSMEIGRTSRLNSMRGLPTGFVRGAKKILELMNSQAYVPVFQPIVTLPDRRVIAYETLTRGRHPDLPQSPHELFRIAAELGLEAPMSRGFRRKALRVIGTKLTQQGLFLNTHPEESISDLIDAARELRTLAPSLDMVLEVHEHALVDATALRKLRTALIQHRIQLAFDDFGAGQARLLEFAEVPPDYLKFDIGFIHGIDTAVESKRRVLASIVRAASELGVKTIAEGVETEAEAAVCADLGLTHAQGFLFGRAVESDQI